MKNNQTHWELLHKRNTVAKKTFLEKKHFTENETLHKDTDETWNWNSIDTEKC